MEEEGSPVRLIVGIIAVIVLAVILFFVVRGFLTKKSATTGTKNTTMPTVSATPTPYGFEGLSATPAEMPKTGGGSSNGYQGTKNTQYVYPTVYYYQSQGNSSSQSQSGGNSAQSQSQTLPGGTTQSQNK